MAHVYVYLIYNKTVYCFQIKQLSVGDEGCLWLHYKIYMDIFSCAKSVFLMQYKYNCFSLD